MPATIVALHLSTKSRAPMRRVERVDALENRGLDGDRHAKTGSHRQVLLIMEETLREFGLEPSDVREQVVVRGLDLYGLPQGTQLRIGDARLALAGPCEPCQRMNEVRAGLMSALDGKRGRFATVSRGGAFSVGDTIEVEHATTAGDASR